MYRTYGVYEVTGILASPFDKNDPCLYYEIVPLFGTTGGKAYIPTDSTVVPLRPIITEAEARAMLDGLRSAAVVEVTTERERKTAYRAVMQEQTPLACARILRTVAARRKALTSGKRLTETDAEFEREAAFCLFCELAAALHVTPDDAERMFYTEASL